MTPVESPWQGDYGTGPAAWQAVLDEAVAANDPDRTPHRLAKILMSIDPVITRPRGSRRAGLPTGKPETVQTRTAARLLLGWAEQTSGRAEAAAWRVLALLSLTRYPQDGVDGSLDEIQQRTTDHEVAVATARAAGDPFLLALALLHLAISSRDSYDSARSLRVATEAQLIMARMPPGNARPPGVLAAAIGDPLWLPSTQEVQALLQARAHARAGIAARLLRDYDRAVHERDLQIAVASGITDSHPTLLLGALGARGALARSLGDITTALSMAERQSQYCVECDTKVIRRKYLISRHSFAKYLDDWDTVIATRVERVQLWVSDAFDISEDAEVTPAIAREAIVEFKRRSDKAARTGLGNDAYELATARMDSGRAALSEKERHQAREWLAVAEMAWDGYGLNGPVAVGFRRLELDAIEGIAGDSLVVGRRMVEFSRRWRRAVGPRRAALEAVRWGAAGDPVILDRLFELRHDAPPVDAAFLDLGIGHWHLRAGDAAHDESRQERARVNWREAVHRARAAAIGLSIPREDGPPLLLNPFNFIEALQVHAQGLRRLREAGDPAAGTAHDELTVRVNSLPAIAQRFTASTSPTQRAVIDQAYSAWLEETAELAVTLNDHAAADAVAEVIRRDMVGTILFALTSDPDVPEQVAQLAARLIATLNATVTDTAPASDAGSVDPDDAQDTSCPSTQDRAGTLDEQLTQALDIAGEVIGPVARTLFDPQSVLKAGCTDVLTALHPTGDAAVLSLLLSTAGPTPRLFRRLAWRTAESGAGEYLDVVDAPDWLPDLSADDDPDLFLVRLDRLTNMLLPPELLDVLSNASPERPLALTVVPSGVLGVPFAALPISEDHLLIDLASISTVQSLRTALTLASTDPSDTDPTPMDLAIYDFDRLVYTRQEYDVLKVYRPQAKEIRSLAALKDAIGNPRLRGHVGILALAIHGSAGVDGWSQTKQLPSGERLTAGHILQWYIPRLVVAGSCNTSIRTGQGGELGGFPMAFQLRGAATIIGTLYDVEDRATAQIMGLFYAALDAEHPPASALREAQRSWISTDRAKRLTQTHRWAYLLTYGIPT